MAAPTIRLLQLTATLLAFAYFLSVGGTYVATVQFRLQLFNAVAAGSLALAWMAARVWRGRRVARTGLEGALLVFVLSQFAAAGWSAQPRLSLEAAMAALTWGLAFLLLCDLLASGWPREFVIDALVLTAVVITAQGLLETSAWFVRWAQLRQLPPVAFRLFGFLGHANLTTAIINLLLPILLARALLAPARRVRVLLALLALGLLAVEFFASSRGGWIAGAAELALFALLAGGMARERRERWRARWQAQSGWVRLGAVVVALGVLAAGLYVLAWQTFHPTHGSLSQSRQGIWRPAWALFVAHPLTGAGPDLYAWFFPRFESVPPAWLPPHAHSLVLQLLSGSGVLGLGTGLALFLTALLQIRRRWSSPSTRIWGAAFISALVGLVVHHLFDYVFITPTASFILVAIGALAFTSNPSTSHRAAHYHPALLALPLALVMAFTAYSLRAGALNEQGLQLASRNEWPAAAERFRRAAQADPGLTLFWQAAAYAYTRAGDLATALPLWQRAARDEPYWAVPRATLALLTADPDAMRAAWDSAPLSHLYALNAGALYEASGDRPGARAAYQQALALHPPSARALFWQQTALRAEVLSAWQASQPPDRSPLALGWAALEAGDAPRALSLFQQARVANPASNLPYVGLARAYWALGDEANAERALRAGQALPVTALDQLLDLEVLAGDWAEAHADREGALAAYGRVFSAFNDYTLLGPGTYGHPTRYWYVYHREALPSDLVPQFIRADITPALDVRFARLARWYEALGERATACFILARVEREAPQSTSGSRWRALCR